MTVSIWSLKKMPLPDVVAYIRTHGGAELQAEMAGVPLADYAKLSPAQAEDRLTGAIAAMDDERYSDYLLQLIDE